MDGTLTGLVKQINEAVDKNADMKLCAFVVILTDDADGTAKKLESLAAKEKLDHVPLTLVEGVAGPDNYKIAKDAEVTVMLWKEGKVKTNHAFKKGELHKKEITAVMDDVKKLLE